MSLPITGTTQLLGVIGDPVRHSLSPVMHNAALAVMGLDYVYVPFPVKAVNLPAVLKGFEAIEVKGFNITIPHKQAIFGLLDQITPIAQQVGAVNTVWRSGGLWRGTNTDVQGFISPLLAQSLVTETALILGAGGAARAVVAACQELGFTQIVVVGRDLNKLRSFGAGWSFPIQVNLWDDLPGLLPQATLVVNTTPVGMEPLATESPLSLNWIRLCNPETIVYDLIYSPNPTILLKLAQERGLKTIDGLEMLVQQGAAALEIWTQSSVPVAVMRSALRNYLQV